MSDPIEFARKALDFYVSTAHLTSTYWGAYLTVAAAIIGYTVAASRRPTVRLRVGLTIAFLIFSVANLSALVNKHSLHAAAAKEVVVAVDNAKGQWPQSEELRKKIQTVCCGFVSSLMPVDCLHAMDGRTTFWFHVCLDLVVLVTIWHDVRRKR